jgi:hypothetical protein
LENCVAVTQKRALFEVPQTIGHANVKVKVKGEVSRTAGR